MLLTFDVEFEPDAASLLSLAVEVPATYFWTGAYARKYPDLLRRLADEGHTIGSHSFHHDDLTTLNEKHLQLDLELARIVISDIAGVPVTAFRAPYLEHNDAVMQEVARQGFLIDSSDSTTWPRNQRLPTLGISEFEGLLISDYDIFEGRRFDSAAGLDFLIRAYEHHAIRDRPFVVLLHPRFIAPQSEALAAFIAHVEETGGRFLTLDQHLEQLAPDLRGLPTLLWADPGLGHTTSDILRAAEGGETTDVMLILPYGANNRPLGPSRDLAMIRDLQDQGLRVHVGLSMTLNPALAAALPHATMVDRLGAHSRDWVSPSHPEVRRSLAAAAEDLVTLLNPDGLFLHGLGYPDLDHDFSASALHRFGAETELSRFPPETLMLQHYVTWTRWRFREMASLVEEVADAARSARPGTSVGLLLLPEAATDYRVQEVLGQDYRSLGDLGDMIGLIDHHGFAQDGLAVTRTVTAVRTQAGGTALFLVRPPGDALGAPRGLLSSPLDLNRGEIALAPGALALFASPNGVSGAAPLTDLLPAATALTELAEAQER